MATESERIVLEFLRLLHRAANKTSDSTLLPSDARQNLPKLQTAIDQGDDTPKAIAKAITNWCRQYKYVNLLRALRPTQADAIAEDEDPDIDSDTNDRIRQINISIRSVNQEIETVQNQEE